MHTVGLSIPRPRRTSVLKSEVKVSVTDMFDAVANIASAYIMC